VILVPGEDSSTGNVTGGLGLARCVLVSPDQSTLGSSTSPLAALTSDGLSQQEILQNELPFPPSERIGADLTSYLDVARLRPSFDFDALIKCLAVRASE
jgi:hypothetical protein